ncbi:MAG: TIGR00366 family protein [Synergistes jonesii]|uniref:YfcC family protein n=1 Tax=Synergistes jonesii TaxID=2754 RepID=UPI002A753C05|nr:TIGR00366 family protein [Synergistes jonesii]MDY2984964.1 TIGR00366 family protein [Synergistes jonesii]
MKLAKTEIRMPHTYVLLFFIVAAAALLTWIVPAGEFQYHSVDVNGTTRNLVVPGSFKFIAGAAPVGLIGFFSSFQRGIVEVSDLVALIFIVNAAFAVVIKTGSFEKMLGALLRRLEGREFIVAVIFYLFFALGASLFGMWNDFNGMIPIMVGVGAAMGFDAMYGFAIIQLGIGIGFAAALTNPFTIVVAQSIAGIPIYSGMAMRVTIFAAFSLLALWWIHRYGKSIKRDPSLSLVPRGEALFSYDGAELKNLVMGAREYLALAVMLASLALIFYGCLWRGWGSTQLTAVFLMMGVSVALIFGWSADKIAEEFLNGARAIVFGALIVGVARAILVVLREGHTIDTIIFYLSNLIEGAPPIIAAEGMLFIQTLINFAIPSGSGQAAAIMPIMAPLGDVAGLTREVTVLAFQLGDGFSNLLWPTCGIATGCGIAGISLAKWWKFFLKLFGLMWILMMLFVAGAVIFGF